MRRIAALLLLLAWPAISWAQSGVPNYPQTLPASTVVGRLGASAGPSQAIPFSTLAAQLTLAQTFPWASVTGKPSTLAGYGITSPLPYNQGGTNNTLTAINGGLVYSDASKFNILAAPVGSGLCLLSTGTTSFAWASCSGSAAVASVTGTANQINASPTTGAVVLSLPSTFNIPNTTTVQYNGNTMTFPSSAATLAALNIQDQSITGGGLVTPNTLTAGTSFTADCGKAPLQTIVNNASFTITAPAITTTNSQDCAIQVINGTASGNAGTVTLSGFSKSSPKGDTFSTATTANATATFTNSSQNIGWTSHGLTVGAIVFFATSGSLPTNFATTTLYWVVSVVDANTIKVASTPGGSAITAGSSGSGTQTGYVPSVFNLIITAINGPVQAIWTQVQ